MCLDAFCQRRVDSRHGGQFYHRRLSNHIHRTEMFQEGFALDRANAGDGIQRGGHALLRTAGAVGCYGKAVRLVTDTLDEIKSLRVTRQEQAIGLIREEYLLFLLRQSHHRDFVE